MQKRVGLARAIARRPEILFFDEPTTGLDPIMADVINDLIAHSVRQLGASAEISDQTGMGDANGLFQKNRCESRFYLIQCQMNGRRYNTQLITCQHHHNCVDLGQRRQVFGVTG